MTKRALLAAFLAVASLSAGCLYIPPLHHTAGATTVQRIEAGTATRDDVRGELGRPNVVGKKDLYVYDWDQSYGFLFVGGGYSAGGGEITGKHFHAVVYFENDRVARFEWDSRPPARPIFARSAFVPAPVSAPLSLAPPVPGDPASECAAFSFDLARCLVAHDASGSAWIEARGREQGRLAAPWKSKATAPPWEDSMLSPDDRLLVARRRLFGDEWAGWWLDDGRSFPLVVDGRAVAPLAFSGDGGQLVAERRGGEAVVLDTRDGRVLLRTRPLRDRLQSASLASDRIAVTTNRGDIALLDRASGAVTAHLRSRPSAVNGRAVALSPDGRHLAAATSTAVELWDVAALEAEQRARPSDALAICDDRPTDALRLLAMFPAADCAPPQVAFSPDGALVAAGAGRHVVLARASGGSPGWLEAPEDATATSSREGKRLAAGFTGLCSSTVKRVSFSADGQRVFVLFGAAPLTFEAGVP